MSHWPKFETTYLKSCCDACWGSYRLKDASKKLVVPVYNLDNGQEGFNRSWEPVLFHNIKNENLPMGNEMAADIVLRATVAPTYFTSHKSHVGTESFVLVLSSLFRNHIHRLYLSLRRRWRTV